MTLRGDNREPHPITQEGWLTYETITKITTLPLSPLAPQPHPLLTVFSLILPLVFLSLSGLFSSSFSFLLKISGGGPLIAPLISHVRQLRGFTRDVELLQIITCPFPFSSDATSLPPSPVLLSLPPSIPLTHSS